MNHPSPKGYHYYPHHRAKPSEQHERAHHSEEPRSSGRPTTCTPHQAAASSHQTSPELSEGDNIVLYDSPSDRSLSDQEPMEVDDRESATNSETGGSPRASAAAHRIGRLSLDQARSANTSPAPPRQRDLLCASGQAAKRRASIELNRSAGQRSPRWSDDSRDTSATRNAGLPPKHQRRHPLDRNHLHRTNSGEDLQRRMMGASRHVRPSVQSHDGLNASPVRHDSGYASQPSRMNTTLCTQGAAVHPDPSVSQSVAEDGGQLRPNGLIQLPPDGRYPGLMLQPDSSPISQDQLAAEVKGIYAGLVMVEAKCINIDAAQAADPNAQLGPEQWQASIALHRTLLYEHHDFLMATQHPSATPALRGLATKYSMPARMWKHGIHAFLEVLRHRRPESQDYMLAFIYLAYQMTALLYETVPSFTDTWIECLGDLARYRMAIEEEKEAHAIWGGVAARWYTLASDRHPAIGRLYHHLGILERPSLRKLCLYAKSLTCVIPFPNARDSLLTLCNPIVHDEQTLHSGGQSAEARIVTVHALNYIGSNERTINIVRSDALRLLLQQPTKLREFGAHFAITNTAAIFELGSPTNPLAQQYSMVTSQGMQHSRPSGSNNHTRPSLFSSNSTAESSAFLFGRSFWIESFNFVLQKFDSATILDNGLAFLHVMLVFLHSLHSLRVRLLHTQPHHTFCMPFNTGRLAWIDLAAFLNSILQHYPVTTRVLECSRQGVFLSRDSKVETGPFCEDYLIRGLSWTQFYFPAGLFDGQCEDDGRTIETPAMQDARAERVLWLGLYLAFHTEDLQYDQKTKTFSACLMARPQSQPATLYPAEVEIAPTRTDRESTTPSPQSRSSRTASSSSESDDGFTLVKAPSPQQSGEQGRSGELSREKYRAGDTGDILMAGLGQ
ncbi:hypothetical protein DOTSEDRAFT_71170 [Dothistroma septosporum NZE10]|uniref:Nonsense-mediated mRNA decay factor n=1 Tax=Dothistroma septosporum (strain NZE10 / CBS 128990) TaxID=675120 RepID=N1PSE7_DOTSN|nr:hypothetical protein DOTSEDRAFT_71170 [Dothistroma septosporum NZE10]